MTTTSSSAGFWSRLGFGALPVDSTPGVCGSVVVESGPVSSLDVSRWEQSHYPLQLPHDLRAFLAVTNGLVWRYAFRSTPKDEALAVGHFRINSLQQIKPITIDRRQLTANRRSVIAPAATQATTTAAGAATAAAAAFTQLAADDIIESSDDPFIDAKRLTAAAAAVAGSNGSELHAFDLDDSSVGLGDGRTALLISIRTPPPATAGSALLSSPVVIGAEVWFCDAAREWWFVASSVTAYLRLAVLHAAVPFWRYAFTASGVPPLTAQLIQRFAGRSRLAMDERMHRRTMRFTASGAAASTAAALPPTKHASAHDLDGFTAPYDNDDSGDDSSDGERTTHPPPLQQLRIPAVLPPGGSVPTRPKSAAKPIAARKGVTPPPASTNAASGESSIAAFVRSARNPVLDLSKLESSVQSLFQSRAAAAKAKPPPSQHPNPNANQTKSNRNSQPAAQSARTARRATISAGSSGGAAVSARFAGAVSAAAAAVATARTANGKRQSAVSMNTAPALTPAFPPPPPSSQSAVAGATRVSRPLSAKAKRDAFY